MATNEFKLYCTSLTTTNETTLLTVGSKSTYLVSSIIITNTTTDTDSTIIMTVTDTSAAADFKLLNAEPMKRTISREVLFRPLILENLDVLKVTAATANIYDIMISYLDRNRN